MLLSPCSLSYNGLKSHAAVIRAAFKVEKCIGDACIHYHLIIHPWIMVQGLLESSILPYNRIYRLVSRKCSLARNKKNSEKKYYTVLFRRESIVELCVERKTATDHCANSVQFEMICKVTELTIR